MGNQDNLVRLNVILGISGSVASIKVEELAEKLSVFVNLRLVTTQAGKRFLDPNAHWSSRAIDDESEWHNWKKVGDPVQHIELRKWADVLLIAPLSANTLAKISQGLCDNLLTSIARAWDYNAKEMLVAPAMNTFMWENPLTTRHLKLLQDLAPGRVQIINPVEKTLACGDIGQGAMAHVDTIVEKVREAADNLLKAMSTEL